MRADSRYSEQTQVQQADICESQIDAKLRVGAKKGSSYVCLVLSGPQMSSPHARAAVRMTSQQRGDLIAM